MITPYIIETWRTGTTWTACNQYFGIEAEGGACEDDAINEVVGACLIALGHRKQPPRSVEFIVQTNWLLERR
jgi:hypothetical protein